MSKRMTRREMEWRLITKSWKDEAFRKQLLEDPKAAAEKELKIKFKDNAKVVVHQETPNSLHIVLPHIERNEISEVTERAVLVRDHQGVFYKIPIGFLGAYAIDDTMELQSAAKEWESEGPDVLGQSGAWYGVRCGVIG